MNGETPVGGVMQLPDEAKQQGAPPHWLAYVAVPSVDELPRCRYGCSLELQCRVCKEVSRVKV